MLCSINNKNQFQMGEQIKLRSIQIPRIEAFTLNFMRNDNLQTA